MTGPLRPVGWRWAAPALILISAWVLSACGPSSPPQITDVSPSPSQGAVHTDVPLKITFAIPMNERSVESRLRIRTKKGHPPPHCHIAKVAAGGQSGCYFHWSSGGRVMELLHPNNPFRPVTTYHVSLNGGIQARDGAVDSLSHSWQFSTEGGPQLSWTFPGNGGTVGPNQAISINFSRLMNTTTVAKALTITPQPPGGYRLARNPRVPGRYLVEPVHPLVPGQTYKLSLARSALDVDGNKLQHPATLHFKVGELGSSLSVVFPAGSSATNYTQVLSATPPEMAHDPASLRVLATAPAGHHYSNLWPSPDGVRVAYTLAGNNPIQILDLSTGKTVSVLGSTAASAAAWSPNGQQLAFVDSGALRLYTVASASSVTLSSPGLTMSGPLSWRPDGAVLAAEAQASGSPGRVALLSPGLKAITFLPTSQSTSTTEQQPVWGPAGATLAFALGSGHAPALWTYRPSNSSQPLDRLLATGGMPVGFLDGNTVLLRAPAGSLYAVNTTTGQETLVVGRRAHQYPQAAAANSATRQLVFTRVAAGQTQVFLANADGSGLVDITNFTQKQALDAGTPSFTGG